MNQEELEETINELEQEKSKYSKEIIINSRKYLLLEENQIETKVLKTSIWALISMITIFLGATILNGMGLLPVLPMFIPLEAISLITSGTCFAIGALIHKKIDSKIGIRDSIKEFSKSNTQSELLQEKIEYSIEEEKYQNKKLINQKIIDSMIEKKNNIDALSEEYTISKKESNQNQEDIKNNINNLKNNIEEKYKELDYLSAYKVIYSNFEKKDNKKFNKSNLLYVFLGTGITYLMCFMPVVGLQSLFSNLQYATSLLIHIIPITLGATGTYTYLKKREDAHAKAFKNLNKELEEMDISNEIEKKYNNGENINKTINKIITEISQLRIELEKEIINLNSLNNEGEIELSKSNDIEISLPKDIQLDEAPIEKGPSLVKKFPYKK